MNIKIINLNKKFGDNVVFNNFNTEVKTNEINCIMGTSGCGKTTLLNILMGFVSIDRGQILGLDDKKISVVFQEDRLCENINSIKNIRLVCNNSINDEQIKKHLSLVGLDDIYTCVNKLSGGMKRRISIVRSVIYNGDIIIMDEPFKGLDNYTKTKVIKYIKDNTKEKTLLIVTHNIKEVYELDAQNIINL